MAIRLDAHRDEQHRDQQWHKPCRVATTANITISTALNNGDTLDGVTLATGDRVLVKDQSTGSQNGIYIVGATPARAYDMLAGIQAMGAFVYVLAGTTNGGKLFKNTNTSLPTIGSTSLAFTEFTSGSSDAILRYGGAAEWFEDHGNTGSTETIDLADGNTHWITLDANCTLTFTGASSSIGGQPVASSFTLYVEQDGTGSRTITWPGSVIWPGGSAPTLSTAAGSVDVFSFATPDGGTNWYGFVGSGVTSIDYAETGDIANVGTTAAAGVSAEIPRADHVHALTGTTLTSLGVVGPILISSTHSTPLVFDDLLQNSDGDDLLYTSL